MLLWRLRQADALLLRHGVICAIDRSGVAEQLNPIAGVDEKQFFRMARTPWRSPDQRFTRPSQADWPAGMLPEWYPPGVKIFTSAAAPDSTRPARRRFDRGR